MQVEWAKSRAQAERWKEEVILLNEEMRWVLVYLQWNSQRWISQQEQRQDVPPDVAGGLKAYATKQAALTLALAKSFASWWYPLLITNGMTIDWPSAFLPLATA